jgi:hypothetical protein
MTYLRGGAGGRFSFRAEESAPSATELFPKRNRININANYFDHKSGKNTKKILFFLQKPMEK